MNNVKSITVTYDDGSVEVFVKETPVEPTPEVRKISVPLNAPIELVAE